MLLLAIGAVCGGCGRLEPAARLVGSVTIDGAPPKKPLMVFVENRDRGIVAAAAVDQAGRFDVLTAPGRGVPEGRYQVALMVPPPPSGDLADALKPGRPAGRTAQPFPAKFGSTATSGLSVDVKLPQTEFAIGIP